MNAACTTGLPPGAHSISVVEVDGGVDPGASSPDFPNPCLAAEGAWAGGGLNLYTFLGNVGPVSGPLCGDPQSCFNVGYNAAIHAFTDAQAAGLNTSVGWWLDVEGAGTYWSPTPANNAQTVMGALAALHNTEGIADVGVYASPGNWNGIVGPYQPWSPTDGRLVHSSERAPRPAATSPTNEQATCSPPGRWSSSSTATASTGPTATTPAERRARHRSARSNEHRRRGQRPTSRHSPRLRHAPGHLFPAGTAADPALPGRGARPLRRRRCLALRRCPQGLHIGAGRARPRASHPDRTLLRRSPGTGLGEVPPPGGRVIFSDTLAVSREWTPAPRGDAPPARLAHLATPVHHGPSTWLSPRRWSTRPGGPSPRGGRATFPRSPGPACPPMSCGPTATPSCPSPTGESSPKNYMRPSPWPRVRDTSTTIGCSSSPSSSSSISRSSASGRSLPEATRRLDRGSAPLPELHPGPGHHLCNHRCSASTPSRASGGNET